MRPNYPQGKDIRIMGRKPKPDAHRTGLQRRLAAEVRAGMETSGCSQADLSRHTGIGEPHISLLLRGLRQGTIGAWDKLLNAAHGRLEAPIRPPKAQPPQDAETFVVLGAGGGGSSQNHLHASGITTGAGGGGTLPPKFIPVGRGGGSLNPRRPA